MSAFYNAFCCCVENFRRTPKIETLLVRQHRFGDGKAFGIPYYALKSFEECIDDTIDILIMGHCHKFQKPGVGVPVVVHIKVVHKPLSALGLAQRHRERRRHAAIQHCAKHIQGNHEFLLAHRKYARTQCDTRLRVRGIVYARMMRSRKRGMGSLTGIRHGLLCAERFLDTSQYMECMRPSDCNYAEGPVSYVPIVKAAHIRNSKRRDAVAFPDNQM